MIFMWGELEIERGVGRRMIISMSKIKKIIKILKNWIEKGVRGGLMGLNPHSNEENFFLFFLILALIVDKKYRSKERLIIIIKVDIKV